MGDRADGASDDGFVFVGPFGVYLGAFALAWRRFRRPSLKLFVHRVMELRVHLLAYLSAAVWPGFLVPL